MRRGTEVRVVGRLGPRAVRGDAICDGDGDGVVGNPGSGAGGALSEVCESVLDQTTIVTAIRVAMSIEQRSCKPPDQTKG